MKRTAVVIDTSASTGNAIKVFSLSRNLEEIPLVHCYPGGIDTEKLAEVLNNYDVVYLFTDGFIPMEPRWDLILGDKLHIIKVAQP